MVKQEPVNLTDQMILAAIPYVNWYAFYRIQKLRRFFGFFLAIFLISVLAIIGIILGLYFTSSLDDFKSSSVVMWSFLYSPQYYILSYVGSVLFGIYLVRRWSRQWNVKLEQGIFLELSETSAKISRIYVASRWKKPNVYFSIPSIYLFISAGVLVGGTIMKINDSYLLLSITVNIHLIILSIPSIIGAIQLWRRKKNGLFFSNISLIFLSFLMPTSIFWILQESHLVFNFMSGEMGIIFGSSIGLSIIMMYFLSKAKKQVLWNKQFLENTTTDESK